MKSTISILSGKKFTVKGKKVISTKNVNINSKKDNGFFVLDMWNQCDIAQLDIFPVEYIVVNSNEEKYELFKYNVVMGSVKDICME